MEEKGHPHHHQQHQQNHFSAWFSARSAECSSLFVPALDGWRSHVGEKPWVQAINAVTQTFVVLFVLSCSGTRHSIVYSA